MVSQFREATPMLRLLAARLSILPVLPEAPGNLIGQTEDLGCWRWCKNAITARNPSCKALKINIPECNSDGAEKLPEFASEPCHDFAFTEYSAQESGGSGNSSRA
jgi:hypothetical protein